MKSICRFLGVVLCLAIGMPGWPAERHQGLLASRDVDSLLANVDLPAFSSKDPAVMADYAALKARLLEAASRYRQNWQILVQRERRAEFQKERLIRQRRMVDARVKEGMTFRGRGNQDVARGQRYRLNELLRGEIEAVLKELARLARQKRELLDAFFRDRDALLEQFPSLGVSP